MNKYPLVILLAAAAGSAFWALGPSPAGIPADLRDAPASSAFEELSGGRGAGEVPAAQPAAEKAAPQRASGKWTGWLEARSDYGYLPGTQNVNSGTRGFKVYYRCSNFRQEADGGYAMIMQFGNDKGGDLGIVTWTTGPSQDKSILVKFEGRAEFSDGHGRRYAPQNPAGVLNALNDYNGFCANAYASLEAHRPTIVKYLMRKDIKSMERLYAAAKFIPGPIGMYAEGMEITLALSQRDAFKAGEGTGCLIAGLAIEKVSHKFVRREAIRYLLEKSCSGAATAYGAVHHSEKPEGPMYFTGVVKDSPGSIDYLAGGRTLQAVPARVRLELAYVEPEEKVKNIFFEPWR